MGGHTFPSSESSSVAAAVSNSPGDAWMALRRLRKTQDSCDATCYVDGKLVGFLGSNVVAACMHLQRKSSSWQHIVFMTAGWCLSWHAFDVGFDPFPLGLGGKTTALIFASGKMVCTGAKGEQQSKLEARKYARIIQKLVFPAKFKDFKIQNIVGSCVVKFPIRLEGFAYSHGAFYSYEPELFPGLIYRMKQPKRWDDALKAYTAKASQVTSAQLVLDTALGRMRCPAALARWEELSDLCKEYWTPADAVTRLEVAPMAANAAWNMREWDQMDEQVSRLDDGDETKI
ncbi:hypothetical protein KIW84_022866 [Lathyrus oleraceus]|uniref:Uncharacterized protein n=1 Tax=Pisum sativum TaxID=3888 RepID=A0A9D4YBH8_PEA|nr:hypothetical protein KIW84_022866 [Pisum sativum]